MERKAIKNSCTCQDPTEWATHSRQAVGKEKEVHWHFSNDELLPMPLSSTVRALLQKELNIGQKESKTKQNQQIFVPFWYHLIPLAPFSF